MIKNNKYNFNLTLGNNLRHSFESSNQSALHNNNRHRNLSLETKIKNLTIHHHKSYSLTKTDSAIGKKPVKKIITLSNANNIFHNIPNYVPIPNGIKAKNYPNLNFITKASNLTQSNSVKTMNNNNIPTNTFANHNRSLSKKFHTISLTTCSSSTNITKKENQNWLNTDSTTQSTDDNRHLIEKLQKENIYLKEKIESQRKFYEFKIKELNQEIFNINEKNKAIMKNYNTMKEENEQYQMKEMKLMKIIYMIKKQGIEIDNIISEVMNEDDSIINKTLSDNTRNNISLTSINFPDKVFINEKNKKDTVPLLDFDKVPSYEPSEDEEEDVNNNTEVKGIKNMKVNNYKIKKNNFFIKKNK